MKKQELKFKIETNIISNMAGIYFKKNQEFIFINMPDDKNRETTLWFDFENIEDIKSTMFNLKQFNEIIDKAINELKKMRIE